MHCWRRIGLLLAILSCAATTAFAGITIALVPGTASVAPGAEFQVVLRVTAAGSLFNGYAASVAYDPAAVTFLQQPAPVQEGAYMRNACGSTFHSFSPHPTQLAIEHVILCPSMALAGPGDLYVLRFRAGTTPGQVTIGFGALNFVNSGYAVPVTSTTAAVVQIGAPTDASAGTRAATLTLHAAPNPFSSRVGFQIAGGRRAVQTILVHDAAGRLVRMFAAEPANGGAAVVTWDGTNARGTRVAPGLYWVTVRDGDRRVTRRVAKVY